MLCAGSCLILGNAETGSTEARRAGKADHVLLPGRDAGSVGNLGLDVVVEERSLWKIRETDHFATVDLPTRASAGDRWESRRVDPRSEASTRSAAARSARGRPAGGPLPILLPPARTTLRQ
ncbi:hypothetical protein GCM10009795_005510 [Nocardioides hankookensis]